MQKSTVCVSRVNCSKALNEERVNTVAEQTQAQAGNTNTRNYCVSNAAIYFIEGGQPFLNTLMQVVNATKMSSTCKLIQLAQKSLCSSR